jgi:hypothetical protein
LSVTFGFFYFTDQTGLHNSYLLNSKSTDSFEPSALFLFLKEQDSVI